MSANRRPTAEVEHDARVEDDEYGRRAARATRLEERFAWPTTIAAIACLPVILLPLVVSNPALKALALTADWLIWLVFVTEIVFVLPIAPDRTAWLRYHRLTVFIVIAAFPGWIMLLDETSLSGLTPALLEAQKLLKLSKVDRLVRKRNLHLPFGRWILLAPAAVAVTLITAKAGWVSGGLLAAALLLGIIGPGGRPNPTAITRHIPDRRRRTPGVRRS